jgi:hypothetical protein
LIFDWIDEDTNADFYTDTQFAFTQFKASVFVQIIVWEGLIFCPNAGYYIKDIVFQTIFQQMLDDCYKTLIDNMEDLSTLWTGWIMDNCEYGDDADVTFFEWEPLPTSVADEYQYWIESTGTNYESSTCLDLGQYVGLSENPLAMNLADIAFNTMVKNQQNIQEKNGVTSTGFKMGGI